LVFLVVFQLHNQTQMASSLVDKLLEPRTEQGVVTKGKTNLEEAKLSAQSLSIVPLDSIILYVAIKDGVGVACSG
jgi:hypothetical protein